MTTILIISVILIIFGFGFAVTYRNHSKIIKKLDFANEYRDKFVELANEYMLSNKNNLNENLYIWLTKNVNKIQNQLGSFGVMAYKPAFESYIIKNYQIIINTIPNFRNGKIEGYDTRIVDDCLIRYIGYLEEHKKEYFKNVKNPVIWFREGFREILGIPFLILNWFGIISIKKVITIKESLIYKLISGITSLIVIISSVVTIIVGLDETIEFITRVFR